MESWTGVNYKYFKRLTEMGDSVLIEFDNELSDEIKPTEDDNNVIDNETKNNIDDEDTITTTTTTTTTTETDVEILNDLKENSVPKEPAVVTKDVAYYKKKYDEVIKELTDTKRRLKQQHIGDLKLMNELILDLEKKLENAYKEIQQQVDNTQEWRLKINEIINEVTELRQIITEQNKKVELFEKKQQLLVSERNQLEEELEKEKINKVNIVTEKQQLEDLISDLKKDLEEKEVKLNTLQTELVKIISNQKIDEENASFIKQKIDYEKRLQLQTLQIERLISQVEWLEKVKSRLELSVESIKEELEKEICKKNDKENIIKTLQHDLETEQKKQSDVLKEKIELEEELLRLKEEENQNEKIEELEADLMRTKMLVKNLQGELEKEREESPGKAIIQQLKNQLEDLECAREIAVKAKHSLETDLLEMQFQMEELQSQKRFDDDRAYNLFHEKTQLENQLKASEAHFTKIFKELDEALEKMLLDQNKLQDEIYMISNMQSMTLGAEGDEEFKMLQAGYELKINELTSKLKLEQVTKSMLEVRIQRKEENLEAINNELYNAKIKDRELNEQIVNLQRQLRQAREEMNKNALILGKKDELEKRFKILEAESVSYKRNLDHAQKRVEVLQNGLCEICKCLGVDDLRSEEETDKIIEEIKQ